MEQDKWQKESKDKKHEPIFCKEPKKRFTEEDVKIIASAAIAAKL